MLGISVEVFKFLVFCLGVYVLVYLVRKLAEGIFPNLAPRHWWKEVLLPVLPPFLGALVALVALMYPYPAGISSTSARVLYGLVCGFFSALIYRVVWAYVKKKLADQGIDISQFESLRPAAKLQSLMPGAKPLTVPPPKFPTLPPPKAPPVPSKP